MSHTFSALEICELALQEIGAYSTADTGADPDDLDRALKRLDMLVAELAGTETCFWLRPDTLTATLTADTASYALATLFASVLPDDGIFFPIAAYWRNSAGFDTPIEIIRRSEYEDIADKDTSGTPSCVYIDRLVRDADQTIYIYPVPSVSTISLRLDVQTHAPDLTLRNGKVQHGFWPAWQDYLVLSTAARIGSGPVRRLPLQEIAAMETRAAGKKRMLQYANNRERQGQRRVKAWGA